MTTATLWTIARRWGWLIALSTVIGTVTAVTLSGFISPTYRANATILVMPQPVGTLQQDDLATSGELAGTLSQLVTIRPVLERAAAADPSGRSPGEIGRLVEASQVGDSQLIVVEATGDRPERASDLANLVAQTFIASPEASLGQDPLSLALIEPAAAPSTPVAPDTRLNGMLGALLGLASSMVLVLLYERLDRSISRPDEIYQLTGLPTLARFSDLKRRQRADRHLAMATNAGTPAAEEYHHARTSLKRALQPDQDDRLTRRVLAVTSPRDDEGRTSVVAGLAVVFGLGGYRTLIIDADLRQPTLHEVFGTGPGDGLVSLLTGGRQSLATAVRQTSDRGVWLLSTGSLHALAGDPHPADLLESPRMADLLAVAAEEFDLVLINTPATLEASEALVLAAAADAILMVVRARRTKAEELTEAVDRLEAAPAPIVGVILNRVRGTSHPDAMHLHAGRPTMLPLPPASGPGTRGPGSLEAAARSGRDREAAP